MAKQKTENKEYKRLLEKHEALNNRKSHATLTLLAKQDLPPLATI